MKPTYQHQLLTSFYMWFDHFLLDKADAYENFTTDFYNMTPDVRLPDNTIYGSPYKQWVYDRSIAGATTPVIKDDLTTLTPGGAEGLMLDYENGRAIFNDGYTPGGTINGSYSVKNFNTYVSNQDEESLIIEGKYKVNARYTRTLTGVAPYDEVVPAVFLSTTDTTNVPFALGGEDNTISHINAVAFAENTYQLDGILSVFADASKEIFAEIPYTGAALDEYGDVKSSYQATSEGGFNYTNVANNFISNFGFIQNTTVSKISDRMDKFIPVPLYVGFIDFEINKYRFPRQ